MDRIYTKDLKFAFKKVFDKGAKGLMQIMDSTGEWIADKLEVENFETKMLFDPEINIEWPYEKIGGIKNLIISEKDKHLMSFFDYKKLF